MSAAGLAPGQLGDVGVLLLRHHRRAGGVAVVEAGEAELVARPQHPLLAHAGQVDGDQGQVEERLGHEVPVGDGVEAVVEDAGEAEVGRRRRGVERQRRAGQRAGAERRHVEAGRPSPAAGRRRGRAPSRGPAGGGPAAPAGPAAGGCSRAGRRRPRRRPARAAPAGGRGRAPRRLGSSSLHQSRRSVATWSLRLRPVWSLAPAGPASSVTRRSTAVWMSSSVGTKANVPVGQLGRDLVERVEDRGHARPRRAARPAPARGRGPASRATSWGHSRRSNGRLAV